MTATSTRRDWLKTTTASLAAGMLTAPSPAPSSASAQERPANEPFVYCLNTSTISGQKLPITQVVEVASRAGFQAIEPWIRELDQHVKDGGNLKDLGKRIKDQGLTVESAIGFAEWVVDDDERRKKALEQAKREMDMVLQIGGKRIAAPPAGATKEPGLNLLKAAERYRALLEIGAQTGVVPQVELWGFSQNLNRLGECALVAMESGHPQACILADVYHLYKGGSALSGLKLLSATSMFVMHINDYPANPPRAEITDAQRIYPGDGVAPLKEILRTLHAIGFRGALSLEMFNRDYWKQDALAVAKLGLEKTKAVVRESFKS
ncbi:MAG: sugar phosphate isomerase/epimerase [Planctomycetia bacterium]|nr:sugar phosphate isomerase/epimerase [Planctomycetia bacterium]